MDCHLGFDLIVDGYFAVLADSERSIPMVRPGVEDEKPNRSEHRPSVARDSAEKGCSAWGSQQQPQYNDTHRP